MGAPRVALAVGLSAVAVALALVASGSPPVVVRSGAPLTRSVLFGRTSVRSRICQADEVLPAGASAVRVWLEAVIGPAVQVEAISAGRLLARGSRGPGWTAGSVTVPIEPVPRSSARAKVCVNVGQAREPIGLRGVPSAKALAAVDRQGPVASGMRTRASGGRTRAASFREGPLGGRVIIEYLRPGRRSWWSLARSLARRMELGHAGAGAWIPLLALALVLAIAALMSRALLKETT
jgi:hypothetical protein